LFICFSFVSNTSFIAFPSLGSRPEVRLTFDLKSRASTGVVLFNSGGPLYADYVAVELVNGHVTLRVNKGDGDIPMTSHAPVDDGEWHQVRAISYLNYGNVYHSKQDVLSGVTPIGQDWTNARGLRGLGGLKPDLNFFCIFEYLISLRISSLFCV